MQNKHLFFFFFVSILLLLRHLPLVFWKFIDPIVRHFIYYQFSFLSPNVVFIFFQRGRRPSGQRNNIDLTNTRFSVSVSLPIILSTTRLDVQTYIKHSIVFRGELRLSARYSKMDNSIIIFWFKGFRVLTCLYEFRSSLFWKEERVLLYLFGTVSLYIRV